MFALAELFVRVLAMLAAVALAVSWLWIAFLCMPLVVPADHNPDLVKAHGNASLASFGMAGVCVLLFFFAAGILGRGGWALVTAGVLAGSIVFMCSFFNEDSIKLVPLALRLLAPTGGMAVVVVSVILNKEHFQTGDALRNEPPMDFSQLPKYPGPGGP